MGQLIVRFAKGNPTKAELKIELDLPGWTEEEQTPVEIVVDGISYRREDGPGLQVVQPKAAASAA